MTKAETRRLPTDEDGIKDLHAQSLALQREIRDTVFRVRAEANARKALHEAALGTLEGLINELQAVLARFTTTNTLELGAIEKAVLDGQDMARRHTVAAEAIRQEFTVLPPDPERVADAATKAVATELGHPQAPGPRDDDKPAPAFLTAARITAAPLGARS